MAELKDSVEARYIDSVWRDWVACDSFVSVCYPAIDLSTSPPLSRRANARLQPPRCVSTS